MNYIYFAVRGMYLPTYLNLLASQTKVSRSDGSAMTALKEEPVLGHLDLINRQAAVGFLACRSVGRWNPCRWTVSDVSGRAEWKLLWPARRWPDFFLVEWNLEQHEALT